MNNRSRKSILTRCIVAACITLVPFIATVVSAFPEQGVIALLYALLTCIGLFIECFGFCIEPLMYFRLVKEAFVGGATAMFHSVFWGLIMIFIGGAVVGVKCFILGIKGIIYLIKTKEA